MVDPNVIVPLAMFATPVMLFWIKKHYAAVDKGQARPLFQDPDPRVAQLEAQSRDLIARVQNLESIVIALDEAPAQRRLTATTMTAE